MKKTVARVLSVVGLLTAMTAIVLIATMVTGRFSFGANTAQAQALPAYPEPGKPVTVSLPPGRKLEGGVSWHCWDSAPCEPWYTTRARGWGENPVSHTFSNLNGREYVIKEQ